MIFEKDFSSPFVIVLTFFSDCRDFVSGKFI